MWASLLATLRSVLRSPVPYLGALAIVLASLAGLGLGVLALTANARGDEELAVETGEGLGVLVALVLLVRLLDGDARSGLALAADQTAPGERSRLLGRVLGCSLAGWGAAVLGLALVQALAAPLGRQALWLLVTIVYPVGVACIWALLWHAGTGSGVAALMGGLGAWGLGHLPWGAPGFDFGAVGALLAGALPARPDSVRAALAQLAACGGLLLLVLALPAPRKTPG